MRANEKLDVCHDDDLIAFEIVTESFKCPTPLFLLYHSFVRPEVVDSLQTPLDDGCHPYPGTTLPHRIITCVCVQIKWMVVCACGQTRCRSEH